MASPSSTSIERPYADSESAVGAVEDGMAVGLGSGSTAAHAIRALGREVDSGLDVEGVPTSFQARELAIEAGIALTTLDERDLDLAIDGADQVAGADLVKGGGGAHAREKVVDAAADRLLVVVDPTGRLPADTVEVPVQLNDLYPTILELCGADPPETDSVSLLSEHPRERAFSYYENTRAMTDAANADFSMIDEADLPPRRQCCVWESPERKLIWYPETGETAGPNSGDEELESALREHRQSLSPIGARDADVEVSDDVREQIRDMGYLV